MDIPSKEVAMAVTQEIFARIHRVAQELENLQKFLSQNKDVARMLNINIIFQSMSCDLTTLKITPDCQCIYGPRERLLDNLEECRRIIME